MTCKQCSDLKNKLAGMTRSRDVALRKLGAFISSEGRNKLKADLDKALAEVRVMRRFAVRLCGRQTDEELRDAKDLMIAERGAAGLLASNASGGAAAPQSQLSGSDGEKERGGG